MMIWDTMRQVGRSPIAVDMGSTSIKMLQFQGRGPTLSVAAGGLYVLPSDLPASGPERVAACIEGLEQLLAGGPYRGRISASSLADHLVQYKNIRMPSMPPTERVQAVQWEAADRFQLADDDKVEYLEAGTVNLGEETRDELILMAASDQALREHVQILTGAGLKPMAIEPIPVALARCFGRFVRRDSDRQQVRVILDIGGETSKVLILRGRSVAFYKPIDIGGRNLDQAVADRLDLSLAEAADLRRTMGGDRDQADEAEQPLFGDDRQDSVARAVFEATRPVINELAGEVGLCLRYYSVTFRGSRPNRIEIVGGEHQPHLAQSIAEHLQLEVVGAQPLDGIDVSGEQVTIERRETQVLWATAVGLGLRPMAASLGKRGAA